MYCTKMNLHTYFTPIKLVKYLLCKFCGKMRIHTFKCIELNPQARMKLNWLRRYMQRKIVRGSPIVVKLVYSMNLNESEFLSMDTSSCLRTNSRKCYNIKFYMLKSSIAWSIIWLRGEPLVNSRKRKRNETWNNSIAFYFDVLSFHQNLFDASFLILRPLW